MNRATRGTIAGILTVCLTGSACSTNAHSRFLVMEDSTGAINVASNDKAPAAEYNHLLYEDEHMRLIEVSYDPGSSVVIGGSPYSAVLAFPGPQPDLTKTINGASIPNAKTPGHAPPGRTSPFCATVSPEPAHRVENKTDIPAHFYRIEFKRIDGNDFTTKWKTWYPYMRKRLTVAQWINISGKKPFGQADDTSPKRSVKDRTLNPKYYDYSDATDSITAAPGQHWLRFENSKIRFLEVIYRPGEFSDKMHGHPYPSVFAADNIPLAKAEDRHLDPGRASAEGIGWGGPPPGMTHPHCWTMGPQSPHRAHNIDTFPLHFYRVEFKPEDNGDYNNKR